MSSDPLRLGLIGCGLNMCQSHLPRLLALPQVRVAGICDPDPEALRRLQEGQTVLGPLASFTDYRHLLEKVSLDGVVISTPHAHHFPQIRDALERGLHVLTEKPLVMRSDHARELIRLRDEHRRVLLVAYQRHYEPEYRYLHAKVAEGRWGRLNLIVGYQSESWLAANRGRWRTDPAVSGGGVVADVMSHMLEAVLWVTGLRPVEVTAHLDNCGTDVEVIATVAIRFAGGAMASLSMNGATPRSCYADELSLWGEEGSVRLQWDLKAGGSMTEWRPGPRAVPQQEWPAASDADTNFVQAVAGRESVAVPAEWGLKVTLLKEAIWEAARTGQVARVAEP